MPTAAKKLFLEIDDIVKEETGYIGPTDDDIQRIIEFGKKLEENSKLLSHCFAGVSRSTAGAFIALCSMMGPGKEKECMDLVLSVRPRADPNPWMVNIADKLMNRNGTMNFELLRFSTKGIYSW